MVSHQGRRCAGSRRRRTDGGRPRPGRPRRHGTGGWRARRARKASGRDTAHRPPWPPPPVDASRIPARHQAQRTTNSRGSGMRRRVARSATRPRDPWSAAGALAGPAGRLVLECVAGASHIWSPWSCQPSRSSANGSSASSRTVSVQECIDLYVDFCQGSARRCSGRMRGDRQGAASAFRPGQCPIRLASRSLLGRQPAACPARSAGDCAGRHGALLQAPPGQRRPRRRVGHVRSAPG